MSRLAKIKKSIDENWKALYETLPKANESTAHAQADTVPLPFEPSKDEIED